MTVYTQNPLFSIVTPVLNGRQHLDECIQSVLKQSYTHIEHVFVDGGSVDGTMDGLTSYQTAHPHRIRIVSEPGSGPGQAWITGIKAAAGEILGCLGVDDICEAGAIEAVADFFRANSTAYFVHGGSYFINERGEILWRHEAAAFQLKDFVNTAFHIATTSAFYRRVVPERVGWLETHGDDFELMVRVARQFEIHHMERVLSRLRLRKDSAFNPTDFEKRKKWYHQSYRVSREHGGDLFSPLAIRYYAAEVIGRLHLDPFWPWLRRVHRKLRGRPGV